MIVDPSTCQIVYPEEKIHDNVTDFIVENQMTREEYFEFKREEGPWGPMIFKLFSLKVAGGFLAGYTPIALVAAIVYLLSGNIRFILIFDTWTGFLEEVTTPRSLIRLIESCYIMRHEENLIGEEESYRMLQEIVRQPDLLKHLSGTSLSGSMHPSLDTLTKRQRKKLDQLDKLERKGWNVASLQQKIKTSHHNIN